MKKFFTTLLGTLCFVMFLCFSFSCTGDVPIKEECPSATHSWQETISDEYKVSDATCRKKTTYSVSCFFCGIAGIETFEHGQTLDHQFNQEGVCLYCGEKEGSKGLKFTYHKYWNTEGYYVERGDCEDANIVIPSTYNGDYVTHLGLFNNCDIESIEIPHTIQEASGSSGNGTFSNCKFLKKVIFEENSQLEYITVSMFSKCTSLENISFENCKQLEKIYYMLFKDVLR